jgi:hypothetical protein
MISFLIVVFGFLGNEVPQSVNCENFSVSTEISHTSNGRENGKLEVKATGGSGEYTYHYIGPGDYKELKSKKDTLTGLKKGKYSVFVQDSNNCVKQVDVIIN